MGKTPSPIARPLVERGRAKKRVTEYSSRRIVGRHHEQAGRIYGEDRERKKTKYIRGGRRCKKRRGEKKVAMKVLHRVGGGGVWGGVYMERKKKKKKKNRRNPKAGTPLKIIKPGMGTKRFISRWGKTLNGSLEPTHSPGVVFGG